MKPFQGIKAPAIKTTSDYAYSDTHYFRSLVANHKAPTANSFTLAPVIEFAVFWQKC